MKRLFAALLASTAIQSAYGASILTTRADSSKAAQGTSGVGVYLFNGVPGLGAFDGTAAKPGAVPIAPVQLPTPTTTTRGGAMDAAAGSNQFQTGMSGGVPTFGQPAFSNLSGAASIGQLAAIYANAGTFSALQNDSFVNARHYISNSNDGNANAYVGHTYGYGFLGFHNQTTSAFQSVPASGDLNVLAWQPNGEVGSVTNAAWPSAAAFRNILDDGAGNGSVVGTFKAASFVGNGNSLYALLASVSDSATQAGITSFTFQQWLARHPTIEAWGGQCNNTSFDNGPIINRAAYSYAFGGLAYHLELPQGQYCYFATPININTPNFDMGGVAGRYSGLLTYNGSSKTADMITVGPLPYSSTITTASTSASIVVAASSVISGGAASSVSAGDTVIASGIPFGTTVASSYTAGSTTVPLTVTNSQTVNVAANAAVTFFKNGDVTQHMGLHDVSVNSSTTMTAGAMVHQRNSGFVDYDHIALNGNGTAWDIFRFEEIDHTEVTHYIASYGQHDCFAVSGNGQDNPSNSNHVYGNGTNSGGNNYAFTGPQYDLIVDIGKIAGCHTGVHLGGGFDNAWWDHASITTNDYNVLIDNGLPVAADGTTWPNQEIMFGPQISMDQAHFDNVVLNDAKCSPAIYCVAVFKGPMTAASANTSSNYPSLYSTPTNYGRGIYVQTYGNGNVVMQGPYMSSFNAGKAAAIYVDDTTAYVSMSPGTQIINSVNGIVASASWSRFLSAPVFVNVTNSYGATPSNVATPNIVSPQGFLQIGRPQGSTIYGEGTISGAAGDSVEIAAGSRFFNSGTVRELFYNRTSNVYDAAVFDALSHQWNISGTSTMSLSASGLSISPTAYASTAGTINKLALYGTTFGFGISAGSLDFVIPSNSAFSYYINGSKIASIGPGGINNLVGTFTEVLTTPSSSTASCNAGQFTDDANYHYVCTSPNNWRRAALSAF